MAEVKRPKVVCVTWVDSVCDSGWQDGSVFNAKFCICETIGFLVNESEHAIALALSRAVSDGISPYGDIIHIPKVAIRSKRIVRL